ncbi:hypothetical protein ACKWTF_007739 [Chironomus riparius]
MNTVLLILLFNQFFEIYSVNLHCTFDIVKDTEYFKGLDTFIEKNYQDRLDFYNSLVFYRCTCWNITITSKDEIVESFIGNHVEDFTNEKVKMLAFKNSTVNYLPTGIKNFMPTISFLMINDIKLFELSMDNLKEFPRLKFIWAANNELVTLNPDLFSRHVIIFVMDFSNNKLKHLDKNSLVKKSTEYADFRNNDCMDRDFDFSADYPFASKFHKSCLFPNEIFCSYKKVNDNYIATIEEGMEYEGIKKTKIRYTSKRLYEDLRVNRVVKKISSTSLNFTEIPKIICKEFKNLEELEIVGSLISKISIEEIRNFERLKVLRMPYNLIKSLPSNTFIFNKNIEVVDLSYNKIESIGYVSFLILPNLHTLTLLSTSCIDGAGSKSSSNLEIFISNIQEKCKLNDYILCKYSTSNFRYIGYTYYCDIVRRKIDNSDIIYGNKFFAALLNEKFEELGIFEKFNGVFGKHLAGKSNSDVEVITVKYDNSRLVGKYISYHLPNLKTIKITHSKLRYLYEDSFHGLQNLMIVDMSHNQLTEIPNTLFEQNKKMFFVDFSDNNIKRISIETFEMFDTSRIIRLAHNPCIAKIGQNFENKQLDSDLNGCKVKEIELFCNEGIKSTNNDCYVTKMEQMSDILPVRRVHNIEDMSKVKDFIIDFALIEYLPTNISSFFLNIKEYCAYGVIKKIVKENFKNLIYLERIDLSNNMIEFIEENVFEDNKRIEQLFLNFNKIKSIPSRTFENLKGLSNLEIKENSCANMYLQEALDSGRRLEVIKYVCEALLPNNFKKVEKTIRIYY